MYYNQTKIRRISKVVGAKRHTTVYKLHAYKFNMTILSNHTIPERTLRSNSFPVFPRFSTTGKTVSPRVKNYDDFSRVFEIANQLLARHSF